MVFDCQPSAGGGIDLDLKGYTCPDWEGKDTNELTMKFINFCITKWGKTKEKKWKMLRLIQTGMLIN